MGSQDINSMILFKMRYENLQKEENKSRNGHRITSFDELVESIVQEGFIDKFKKNDMFIDELFKIILNDYALYDKGSFELGQMWKVFAKLEENGVCPTEPKAQELYLRLAKEINSHSQGSENIDALNKTKFLVSALDSFDTSQYFFGALGQLNRTGEVSAFYAYYADFIKTIAEVCPYEKLTYAILVEQIKIKEISDRGWDYKAIEVKESAEKLRDQLYYYNHYVFSEMQEYQLFGKKIEELMSSCEIPFNDKEGKEIISKFPIKIKKPSKIIYAPNTNGYYTEDSD